MEEVKLTFDEIVECAHEALYHPEQINPWVCMARGIGYSILALAVAIQNKKVVPEGCRLKNAARRSAK